jgi:hypothetical protein
VKELDVHLHLEHNQLTISKSWKEIKTNFPVNIGRFLTQKVIRSGLAQKIILHPDKGASFTTIQDNKWSKKFLRNINTNRSDAFSRFVVTARTNSLPTLSNMAKWYPEETIETTSRGCDREMKSTLAHILNYCPTNVLLMTDRHNRVVKFVNRVIEEKVPRDLVG